MTSEEEEIDRMCIQCDGPNCEAWGPAKRCSRCRCRYYCSVACQKADWKLHKKKCSLSFKSQFENLVASGLDQDTADSFLKSIAGDEKKTEAVNTECPICFANPPNNAITLKACGHAFCYTCLIEWQKRFAMEASMNQGVQVGESGTPCPCCKNTDTEDVEGTLLNKAKFLINHATRVNLPIYSEEQSEALKREALDCVDKVLMAENAGMDAYVTKAKILLALGRHSDAIRAADEALLENGIRESHPLCVLSQEAKAAEARGDMAEYHRKILAMGDSKDSFPLHLLPRSRLSFDSRGQCKLIKAKALEAQNKTGAAFDLYTELFEEFNKKQKESDVDTPETDETIVSLLTGLAHCSYELGKLAHAIAYSNGLMESRRHHPGVRKYKALSLKKLGKLDEAITEMQRAILYETPWNVDENHNSEVWRLYKELCAEKDKLSS